MGNILGGPGPRQGVFRTGAQVRPLPVPQSTGSVTSSVGVARPGVTSTSSSILGTSTTSTVVSPSRVTPTIQRPSTSRLTGVSTTSSGTSVITRPGVSTSTVTGTTTTTTGTALGTSNGLSIVRPGIVNPGTVTGTTSGTTTTTSTVGTAIQRPVVPSIPVYSQQQTSTPSFWSTLIPTITAGPEGITAGVQGVLPNGMTVGGALTRTPDGQIVGAVNGQSTTNGYVVPQTTTSGTYTGGYRGTTTTTSGYTPSSLTNLSGGGTCLPASNGIFGFFENTIGAGVRRIFGIRQAGCGVTTSTTAGVGVTSGVARTTPSTTYSQVPTTTNGVTIGSPTGIVVGRPAPSVMYGN